MNFQELLTVQSFSFDSFLYTHHSLNLLTYFEILIFFGLTFSLWIGYQLFCRILKESSFLSESDSYKNIFQYFLNYSTPLAFFTITGVVYNYFDRWVLQQFYGSQEQGYFTLASQLSTICFIATSSMTPLFNREFSIAHHEQNYPKLRVLFSNTIPQFYLGIALLTSFFFANAKEIIALVGGSQFQGANTALMVFILYPIHQTYGQLSGSALLAMGKTKLYRNIGILGMILSLPITYLFFYSKTKWFHTRNKPRSVWNCFKISLGQHYRC